jgi:hypothetical protein
MPGKIINALVLGEQIKHKLRAHLRALGFTREKDGALKPPQLTKEAYRNVHRRQREAKADVAAGRLKEWEKKFGQYFANGTEIDPARIEPMLEEVDSDKWQTELFRYATLVWSIPVSNGYGRRIRFLVWDKQNGKLIGLIALGDPVFNMRARDEVIGWSVKDREERLVNMLDAFVLGAIPPYNLLLGGKLIACLVRSHEVVNRFAEKYGDTEGIISEKKKNARLVCVTTTSALGRSSVYNRLKLGGTNYFQSIGFTLGYGHFQIPDELFKDMRRYLRRRRNKYAKGHEYGNGPNWRMRVVRRVLAYLKLNQELIRHNMKREIFICPIAANAYKILRGENVRPRFTDLKTVEEIGRAARERWIAPRAMRRPEFQQWRREHTIRLIRGEKVALPEAAPEQEDQTA